MYSIRFDSPALAALTSTSGSQPQDQNGSNQDLQVQPICAHTSPAPVVLESSVLLKAGEIIQPKHLQPGRDRCIAYNPLTGPFSHHTDLVGRVAARDIPAGTVITGSYLLPLAPSQMEARLRNFWRKCR